MHVPLGIVRPVGFRVRPPTRVVAAWRPSVSSRTPRRRGLDAVDTFGAPLRGLRVGSAPEVGPMSSTVIETMRSKIQQALDAEKVEIVDVEGDAQHVTIDVVASAFEGKSSVDRQRMVYKAIWLELQEAVHAVDSMKTATPSEAST